MFGSADLMSWVAFFRWLHLSKERFKNEGGSFYTKQAYVSTMFT